MEKDKGSPTCRLVQIEVCDFKSFGGSHLIGPFADFTGIIGPNGSGKSNVLDSLAFAFYLDRNPRSTSYIHSTNGALRSDKCSVKVTLEEEEGKKKKKKVNHTYERIYDSENQSTLYIDEKEVDEDEYREIISSKGLIPLIFVKQTEVDSIARKTPIELTELFEEISGSKEFQQRYDKLRIESEAAREEVSLIEKRRRAAVSEKSHISDRKEEAKKFRQLQEKEEEIQIESSLFQLFHMYKKYQEIKEQISGLEQKNVELQGRSSVEEEKLRRMERERIETVNKSINIDDEYKDIEQKLRDANASYITNKERSRMLEEQLTETEEKLKQTSKADNKRKENLRKYEEERERIIQELEKLPVVEKVEKEIAEYNNIREQASKQFDGITQKLTQAMKERSVVLNELNGLEDQKQSYEASKEKKEQYLIQYNENHEKETKKCKELESTLNESEKEKFQKSQDIEKYKKTQKEKLHTLQELEKKIDDIRRKEGSDKRKERFKKQLIKMTQIIPGVYGCFSDLIKLSHSKYETAAAAGCGAYSDAIVVKDRSTAIRCLEFLKENGHGDARFLPLLNLRRDNVQTKSRVPLLSSYLLCDPIIKPAVDFVCGHIAVVDSISEAKKLAFSNDKSSSKITVVTLDGTIFDPRGIMTGGTTRKKIEFTHESIDDLENKKAKLEKELSELGNKISKGKSEIEILEDNLLSLRPQLAHRKSKIKEIENRIEITKIDIRSTERQIKEKIKQIEEKRTELKHKDAVVDEINFSQSKNDQLIFKDFCNKVGVDNIKEFEISRLQDFEERYSKRLEYNSRLSQLEAWIEDEGNKNIEEITSNYKDSINEFRDKLEESKGQVQYYKEQYDELKGKLDHIKNTREDIMKDDQSNLNEAKIQRKLCKDITKELIKNTDEMNNAQHEMAASLEVIKSVLQQCRLSNIKLPKINEEEEETEMTNTPSSFTQENNDIKELENTNFDSLKPSQRTMPPNAIKEQTKQYEKQLSDIRRSIQSIRPDLNSDKKYNDVEEELKSIKSDQENSRLKAAQTKKEFLEIKSQRYDLFMKLYEKVDQHIDRIYKSLTRVRNQENRSGTAYLSLEDTDEPYLGGIKYTAMPPHKRFRDLEQLSGGEKAVASLALIIALQENTDAPFIIMDEPDASLDKLNLRAAADALSKISKNTQIISVSLRDRFFEHSDALVGIYKDKNNQSSGVLTLDLNLNQFADQNLELEALD